MSYVSNHYYYDRKAREEIIRKIGEGEEYMRFKVDRGHKDGAEIHVLTTTGIIKIYNAISKKLITKLIARPGKIKKYFPYGNYPQEILKIAKEHQILGYNNI